MATSQGLLILGCGGHARSVADVALAAGIKDILFVDDNAKDGENFQGFSIQKSLSGPLPEGWMCLPASGDNTQRKVQMERAESLAWPLAILISPTATIGIGSVIAPGTFIAHHAHIGPKVTIGTGCIINTGAIVEHDCRIGSYSHIAIGATVGGSSNVGEGCSVFAGATIIDSVQICNNVTLGGGAVVIHDIQEAGVYVGVPAKRTNQSQ